MTENKLKQLVGEALCLDREIEALKEQLAEKKKLLVAEARSREDEHEPGDGEGTRWTAEDGEGNVARVSFPAPSLKAKIDGEGKAIEKVREAAGRHFERLFRPVLGYAPCDEFRTEAADLLGGAAAKKLIKLCTSESAARVSFETKEVAA